MDKSTNSKEYDPVAEYYDHVPDYRNRKDVSFFVELAQKINGSVLEIGSGTGRILIPIARKGTSVTGLDNSETMLELCRNKLKKEPKEVRKRVKLLHEDMRKFDAGVEFNLIISPFRPFQHLLTVEDQLSCLKCVHNHLVKNGTFVLDLFNPSLPFLTEEKYFSEQQEPEGFETEDERKIKRSFRFVSRDYFKQVNDTELIYYVTYPNGKKERLVHRFPMRYLFKYEAEHLLARAGFQIEELYGDYDKNPYGTNYPGELIFVTRKTG